MIAPEFGPRPVAGGGYEFRLWAPAAKTVDVLLPYPIEMTRDHSGWFRAHADAAKVGTRYKFRIDGELDVPDPASVYQPEDVFGPSEIVDHEFEWVSSDWRGRPWRDAVILELHVGTFTAGGTFLSAIERLDDVVATGFTAIELMPVADFAGRWNWGYDGVLWFAPDSAYGRPEDLKALVDAAHARGLMVFLDVVYNHFGPEGNFLPRYAPGFFHAESETPWGAAIDYNVPEVRRYAIENALHWLHHYRFDGLRLDAVHAILRRGTPSILTELSKAIGQLAADSGRLIHLVVENDDNEADLIDPAADPPDGSFRAQWNDDYHHAWHVVLTGERSGYYADYANDPLRDLARSLATGFVYQGQSSGHRNGGVRGTPSEHLPPLSFINFLQNHDQIGNRAFGERLDVLASAASIDAALSVLLMAPTPPLLFMGQEWGETSPFYYFCDFAGDLGEAVRAGRRREFAATYAASADGSVPDPLSASTFEQSKLDWNRAREGTHANRRELVRRLIECRSRFVTPHLSDNRQPIADANVTGTLLAANWRFTAGTLRLLANLGANAVVVSPLPDRAIWNQMRDESVPPWTVCWTWDS